MFLPLKAVALFLYGELVILTFWYMTQGRSYNFYKFEANQTVKERGKILLFTATDTILESQLDPKVTFGDCPEVMSWCSFTNRPADHSAADAVLFHAHNFVKDPAPRRPDQIYVWFTQESPVHEDIQVPPHYINWTMTYRTNSDIWNPYRQIQAVFGLKPDLDRIWESKSKDAVWLSSNCVTDNRRADLIKLLAEKGLKTDIFGDCGSPLTSCPAHDRFSKEAADCRANVMKPYKFYLALENSNCMDYVTEKFWDSLFRYEAVPIVIKRDYYRNYGIPDSAYIAIEDFESLDRLISYVNGLSGSKTAYLEHHQWRKTHKLIPNSNTGFCELCRRLRNATDIPKSYQDLSKWYSPRECEQRLLDKHLGPRNAYDRSQCNINRLLYRKYHWDCS